MTQDETTDRDGRSESPTERDDRKWNDMLQELRVIQTGAQLTAGFLLTLPFQQKFADLTDLQRDAYLGLVVLAATITALVLSPVAIHRRLSGEHVKDRLVEASHVIMRMVLALMALLVAGHRRRSSSTWSSTGPARSSAGGALLVLLVTCSGSCRARSCAE